MKQFALFHFAIEKNKKLYQVIIQPESPWSDIQEALDEFKQEFGKIQQDAIKAEEEAKQKEAGSVTPELVS